MTTFNVDSKEFALKVGSASAQELATLVTFFGQDAVDKALLRAGNEIFANTLDAHKKTVLLNDYKTMQSDLETAIAGVVTRYAAIAKEHNGIAYEREDEDEKTVTTYLPYNLASIGKLVSGKSPKTAGAGAGAGAGGTKRSLGIKFTESGITERALDAGKRALAGGYEPRKDDAGKIIWQTAALAKWFNAQGIKCEVVEL